ncbi:conserved Plasmodium protein, unknown function [Plasmodium vinckei vinckei]|uniref:Uncharacterized protein n=1 Tax=Plasmodium vinckei vinckei TaxID=54757 RepID=A0A449BQS7_PLAVN|nr:conserved Plasmodium protein, unknown function [Plasmodium vinckei vinckei]VEV55794.1 conserved Plasmodium protein, unknown function [Plasmodium vinckei vinckei]
MNKKRGNKEAESNKITNFFKIKKCNIKNAETIEFCEQEYKIQANHDKPSETCNFEIFNNDKKETILKKNHDEFNTSLLLHTDQTVKNISKPHYENGANKTNTHYRLISNETNTQCRLLSNDTNKTKPDSPRQSQYMDAIHTTYNTQENDEKNTQLKSILFNGIKRTNSNGFILKKKNKKQKFEIVKENNDQERILLKDSKLNQLILGNKKNDNPKKRGRKRKNLLHEQNCLKEKESEEKVKKNYFENFGKFEKFEKFGKFEKIPSSLCNINNMNRQGKKEDINKAEIWNGDKSREKKNSVITLFGDDIKIKVNVDENVSSDTNSDLENSFTIFRSKKNYKENLNKDKNDQGTSKCVSNILDICIDKCNISDEWESERKCSYKRNSISDGENYNYKNYLVNMSGENITEKNNCEIASKLSKKFSKHNLFDDTENNNEYNTYLSMYSDNQTDYSAIFKSDAELESKKKYTSIQKGIHNDEHRKCHVNSRASCITNTDTINKKNIINLNNRRSCWGMGFETNLMMEKTTPKKMFENDEHSNSSENIEIQNNISWGNNNAFCKISSVILNKTTNLTTKISVEKESQTSMSRNSAYKMYTQGIISNTNKENHHNFTDNLPFIKNINESDSIKRGESIQEDDNKIEQNNINKFMNNYYEVTNNIEEKLITIKKDLKLNDNVKDILNEKKKIKVLRTLNKHYFDKEYNDYKNVDNVKYKKNNKHENDLQKNMFTLIKDEYNKPLTFFIIGKFTFFSNYILCKKIKYYGYNVSNNLRRCNAILIGYGINPELLKKIKKFNGYIFNEKTILSHFKIDINKYKNLFIPINKDNGKRYKLLLNETNIKNCSIQLLTNKIHNFCNIIKLLLIRINKLDFNKLDKKNLLIFKLKKCVNNFFLFLYNINCKQFNFNLSDFLYSFQKNYYHIYEYEIDENNFFKYFSFLNKFTQIFSETYIHHDLIHVPDTFQRDLDSLHSIISSDKFYEEVEMIQIDSIDEGNLHNDDTPESRSDSSYGYISPYYNFNDIESNDEHNKSDIDDKKKNDISNLSEKEIKKNIKKCEKLKKITSLWSVFFRPNSLYEICGHKNEILYLYKILKKKFPTIEQNKKEETNLNSNLINQNERVKKCDKKIVKTTKRGLKKQSGKKKESNNSDDINNIIFIIYPPNCCVKRIVELICYSCDLCPIYENKVQKYKNINYFFKYTHGLKAVSIYNANKLDKYSLLELNTRNDISICLYEDPNYNINSEYNLPLLDNINHILVKFSYPCKKSIFYRSFYVASCAIKNLKKKEFKMLFETCKLKNSTYSIENLYNKIHLIYSYVNYMETSGIPYNQTLQNSEKNDDSLTKLDKMNYPSFPNNIIKEYVTKHILNKFITTNYKEIEEKYLFSKQLNLYSQHCEQNEKCNNKQMIQLNNDYYFYRGFEIEEIEDIIYEYYDKLFINNKELFVLSNGEDKYNNDINLSDDSLNYFQGKDIQKKENILTKILELFLYSSILIKSKDINILLIAVDMAIYWNKFFYINPYCNNDNFLNEIKLKDNLKNKIEKYNKIYTEKTKKYKQLMVHFKCPFNFSSVSVIYDILHTNKISGFNVKKK